MDPHLKKKLGLALGTAEGFKVGDADIVILGDSVIGLFVIPSINLKEYVRKCF